MLQYGSERVEVELVCATSGEVGEITDPAGEGPFMGNASHPEYPGMDPNNPMVRVPEEWQRKWRSQEYYQLAATRVGPDVPGKQIYSHKYSEMYFPLRLLTNLQSRLSS